MDSVDDVRERCEITHWEPPVYDIEEEMWVAEDPITECMGFGRIEAEALGNLLAVVEEYETDGETGTPYVKLSGDTVRRTWDRRYREDGDGLLGRLRDELGL